MIDGLIDLADQTEREAMRFASTSQWCTDTYQREALRVMAMKLMDVANAIKALCVSDEARSVDDE